jgi:hypothetical protein
MHAAEVVIAEVDSQRGLEILPLFGERISQPGQPSKLHSHRQILPFDMRGTNTLGIWIAPSGHWDGVDHAGWGVAFVWVSRSRIDLHELCEIDPCTQAVMHRFRVCGKAMGSQLEPTTGRVVQFLREGFGILRFSPAKVPRQNQFAVPFDGHEVIGIATVQAFLNIVLLFAAHKAPNLVTLHIMDLNRLNRGL